MRLWRNAHSSAVLEAGWRDAAVALEEVVGNTAGIDRLRRPVLGATTKFFVGAGEGSSADGGWERRKLVVLEVDDDGGFGDGGHGTDERVVAHIDDREAFEAVQWIKGAGQLVESEAERREVGVRAEAARDGAGEPIICQRNIFKSGSALGEVRDSAGEVVEVEVERFEAGEVGQYVQLAGESVAVKLEALEGG